MNTQQLDTLRQLLEATKEMGQSMGSAIDTYNKAIDGIPSTSIDALPNAVLIDVGSIAKFGDVFFKAVSDFIKVASNTVGTIEEHPELILDEAETAE